LKRWSVAVGGVKTRLSATGPWLSVRVSVLVPGFKSTRQRKREPCLVNETPAVTGAAVMVRVAPPSKVPSTSTIE